MVNLIYGLPGTGKTTFLYRQIQKDIQNNQKALLIVPEQQTVEVEATMSRLLPTSAQLSFEVLNFTRLADKLFRMYGGLSYHYITEGMKNLFMWRSLRALQPDLVYYGKKALSDRSMPSTLLTMVNELKSSGISVEKFEELLDNSASDKLKDFFKIYTHYEAMVGAAYDDATNDLGKLAKLLKEHNFFQDYNVYIDGFIDYTAVQYKIIRRIFSQAQNVFITLSCDSPDTTAIHLSGIKKASKKLCEYAGNHLNPPIHLSEFQRSSSPSLTLLGKFLWDFSVKGKREEEKILSANDGDVTLLSCTDAYEEAKVAAARIRSLVSRGYRYREIAVIARDVGAYRGILDAEFEKAGIPFFMSEKTDLTSKPLISMLLLALTIKLNHFRRKDIIAYLKTGFSGFSDYEIDSFEDYVNTWNINGNAFFDELWSRNPEGYKKEMSERAKSILFVANETKNKLKEQLLPFCNALGTATNIGEFCEATYHFLRSLNISEKLRKDAEWELANGEKKEAAETIATFRALFNVLRTMTATVGNDKVTLEEFITVLRLVLDATNIGTIPTAVDEVMVGSAHTLRATGIRHAILIGLCEGEFPAKIKEGSTFSDIERAMLNLTGTNEEKVANELLYAYRAITMPSDGLTMVYRLSNLSGGACYPSLAFRRVKELLAPLEEIAFSDLPLEERIFDKESALEELARCDKSAEGSAICEALSEDEEYARRLEKRRIAISEPACHVDKDAANAIFGKKLYLSQSQIESYASCHFQYYCDHILDLKENERAEFDYANVGSFIHHVLEVFMKEMGTKTINPDTDMDKIKEIVGNEIRSYSKEIFKEGEDVSGRIAHLLVRLFRLSTLIASNLCHESIDSEFIPRFFELGINHGNELGILPPTITMDNGDQVFLQGTIDRVDTYEKDGKVYVRIVDYKTGKKSFSMDDIQKGFGIQLLLYLFAFCDSESAKLRDELKVSPKAPILPAGAVYLSTAIDNIETTPDEDLESVLARASGNIKRSGILLDDENILLALNKNKNPNFLAKNGRKDSPLTSAEGFAAMRDELFEITKEIAREMKSGNASASPVKRGKDLPCKYCNMKQFCRIDNKMNYTEEYIEEDND